MLRKLIKTQELPAAMSCLHQVEGTDRFVLELCLFGFAGASRHILLKNPAVLRRLQNQDRATLAAIQQGGSRLGKILDAELLKFNSAEQCMYLDLP